jgi:hypothetical protein
MDDMREKMGRGMRELSDNENEWVRRAEERMRFLAVECLPGLGEEEPVRDAFRELAKRLRALSDAAGGELAVEAREAWLISLLPFRDLAIVVRALTYLSEVGGFVDNWNDYSTSRTGGMKKADQLEREIRSAIVVIERECEAVDARAKEPVVRALRVLLADAQEKEVEEHNAFFDGLVAPARIAAGEALRALCALVDAMRARAPESLQ